MYASIRRYQTESSQDLTQVVTEKFLPIISAAPGFIAYYGIEAGDGVWASISVFETRTQAEESNRLAADFVKANTAFLGQPQITAGDVVAHRLAAAGVGG